MIITVKPSEDLRFRVGQRWSYRTRREDVESTALVVAVDEYAGGVVLNLFLDRIERGRASSPPQFSHRSASSMRDMMSPFTLRASTSGGGWLTHARLGSSRSS